MLGRFYPTSKPPSVNGWHPKASMTPADLLERRRREDEARYRDGSDLDELLDLPPSGDAIEGVDTSSEGDEPYPPTLPSPLPLPSLRRGADKAEYFAAVMERVHSTPPPPVAKQFALPAIRLLVHICHEMQFFAGSRRPFFLTCDDAAALIGVDSKTAWRWLALLRKRGVLDLVSKGTRGKHGKASRYCWIANEGQGDHDA